jgi:hypothetical protein
MNFQNYKPVYRTLQITTGKAANGKNKPDEENKQGQA